MSGDFDGTLDWNEKAQTKKDEFQNKKSRFAVANPKSGFIHSEHHTSTAAARALGRVIRYEPDVRIFSREEWENGVR